jgi:fused signal recognition particle receptor
MDPIVIALVAAAIVAVFVIVVMVSARGRSRTPSTVSSPAGLGARLRALWVDGVGEESWAAMEETLLAADIGVEATDRIVTNVRRSTPHNLDDARLALGRALESELAGRDRELRLDGRPAVVLVVGVNGSGKTTTIAKLARLLSAEGRTVMLAAADTYRAAAGDQLEVWGEKVGVPVVRGLEGADPASVAHDAVASARAAGIDIVIVDTAGRLHSKKNLMEELSKIHRVTGGASEVLLVLDATGGQNGLTQVSEFMSAVPVTGVVLAKLDGTARGGIVVAVESRLGVPVKLVGDGEGPDDLHRFDPPAFVASLLDEE